MVVRASACSTPRRRVSIVMTTYNGERFLDEQLQSIAAQTYPPCEIVIGDDGSNDATLEIIEAFAARTPIRVLLTVNATRLGWIANFLATADRASGDLLAFCDQDDVWVPHKIERVTRALRDGGRLALHGATPVGPDLAPLPRRKIRTGLVHRAHVAGPWLSPHGSRMVVDAWLLRTFSLRSLPTSLDGSSSATYDEWLFFCAQAVGGVVRLADELVMYRRHDAAVTTVHQEAPRSRWLGPGSLAEQSLRLQAVQSRLTYLEKTAAAADLEDRVAVEAAIAHYRKILRVQQARVALHKAESAPRYARSLVTGLTRGSYGRERTGAGLLELGQDVIEATQRFRRGPLAAP